jgi:hypothetical protein
MTGCDRTFGSVVVGGSFGYTRGSFEAGLEYGFAKKDYDAHRPRGAFGVSFRPPDPLPVKLKSSLGALRGAPIQPISGRTD